VPSGINTVAVKVRVNGWKTPALTVVGETDSVPSADGVAAREAGEPSNVIAAARHVPARASGQRARRAGPQEGPPRSMSRSFQ
jgi:hypothetical protein